MILRREKADIRDRDGFGTILIMHFLNIGLLKRTLKVG